MSVKMPAVVVKKPSELWSHVHPDGSHVVSARLRDGRVIRVIGMQATTAHYPGAPPCPYRELRAWIRQG